MDTYKKNNKCESCIEGFFKTKDESCVYCKARKNGGPACEQCKYQDDSDNIICSYCPKGKVLSKEGKCYDCKEELGDACQSCSFSIDENNNEKLKCNKCKKNYTLSPNGHCIHYQSYYEFIPHCANYLYEVINNNYNNTETNHNISESDNFVSDIIDDEFNSDQFMYSDSDLIENEEETDDNNMGSNFQIQTNCTKCKTGYYEKRRKMREIKCR